MTDTCTQIQTLLTAWVDDDIDAAERGRVERHVAACHGCAARAAEERSVRDLIASRRAQLTADAAPAGLRQRLEATARAERAASTGRARREWRRVPAAIAATLVLAFSGWTLHELTARSTTLLAAQLAADHLKCHFLYGPQAGLEAEAARQHLLTHYGFDAKVPPGTSDGRVRLVGARRCITGEGTNAHILYQVDGQPVSLYLVPETARGSAQVDVLGQHAEVWSRHNGTYVLVADDSVADLAPVARHMQEATR